MSSAGRWFPRFLALLVILALFAPSRSIHGQEPEPAIRLKTGLIVTAAGHGAIADLANPYRIVQFRGPILPEWRHALEASGATILEYLPDYAYVVRLGAGPRSDLRSLPGVRWVGDYKPAYKLAPGLERAQDEIEVMIQLFAGEDPQPVAQAIEMWGGSVRSAFAKELAGYIRAKLPVMALGQLAALPAVSWIERYFPPELDNDVARRYDVMAVDPVWQGIGLFGRGQIVAVADTGLDTGDPATIHPDFRGRVFKGYGLGREGDWSDPNTHGTHVCGSVLGNGVMSGSNPGRHEYVDSFAGVAPEALLIIQSCFVSDNNTLGGMPDNLDELFGPPYQDGARVHSNSWSGRRAGDPEELYGVYTSLARQVDEFIWTHRDMTIVSSASNDARDGNGDGVIDADSVKPPGTAKSIITVGATENYRPDRTNLYGRTWPNDYPADPIKSDKMANDMGGVAAFSGRGPTDDDRIKPDIAAPGTFVVSARSQASNKEGWGIYNDYYIYNTGTSMSTPLTAGAAAVVRQAYTQFLGVATPSAALIKATLLHGARDIYPGQYGFGPCQEISNPVPNWDTGWGRLNLRDSLMPVAPRGIRFVEQTVGLQTGQTHTYNRQVPVAATGSAKPQSVGGAAALRLAPLSADAPWALGDAEPTQAGVCTELIRNNGFEQGLAGWTVDGRTELSTVAKQGRYSAWLGALNNANDWLYQAVFIPADISDGEISFWFNQGGNEPDCDCDYFRARLWSQDWNSIYAEITYRDGPATTDTWIQVVHRLKPEEIEDIRGKWVYLAFQLKTDGSKPTSGRVDEVHFVICTGGRQLKPGAFRATLVWSDYPGALSAAKTLVNDLDLEVIGPNGQRYYPNGGTGPDRINPVEDIIIRDPQPGNYQIIVRGYNVPMGPQPYALLVSSDEPPIVKSRRLWLPLLRKR